MNLWSLEGGYNNYFATSPTGTATGFGASLLMIDDLIKSSLEANNAAVLEKHWECFTNTMLSRLEEGGKIIIIMTRWHSEDLAGRVLVWCREKGKRYKHISMKAIVDKEKHKMLCSEVLSYESAMDKKSIMGEDIFSANYQQEPIDMVGRLYNRFKTYDKIPADFDYIEAYCDTDDEGSDNLCNIVYGAKNNEAYVIDIIYTKESMEFTEKKLLSIIMIMMLINDAMEINYKINLDKAKSVEEIIIVSKLYKMFETGEITINGNTIKGNVKIIK